MNIQKDWDQAIEKEGERFWVSMKRDGQSTIHGYLKRPTDGAEKDNAFIITNWNRKQLDVLCTVTNTQTSFIAPETTFPLSDRRLLCMDISPSGELGVCSSDNGQLWVWDTDNGETKRNMEGHIGDVDSCRFFPSGLVMLSGGSDFRVKIWSVIDGKCARTLTGHTRGITDTSIIEKGRNVITSSTDGSVRLWNCGSGQCISVLATVPCPVNGCGLVSDSALVASRQANPAVEQEYCTDGKVLFTVAEDGNMRLYDVRNRSKVGDYDSGSTPLTRGVSGEPDQVLLGAENGTLTLLDLRYIKDPLKKVSLVKTSVTSLLHYSKHLLLSGYKDGSCTVWNYHDDDANIQLTGPDIDPITAIATPRHMTYTSCRDGCVRIYRL